VRVQLLPLESGLEEVLSEEAGRAGTESADYADRGPPSDHCQLGPVPTPPPAATSGAMVGKAGGTLVPRAEAAIEPRHTHTHCKRGLRPFGSVFLQGWNTREDCDQSLFKGQIGGEGPPLL
jgi:hypothetical protein